MWYFTVPSQFSLSMTSKTVMMDHQRFWKLSCGVSQGETPGWQTFVATSS